MAKENANPEALRRFGMEALETERKEPPTPYDAELADYNQVERPLWSSEEMEQTLLLNQQKGYRRAVQDMAPFRESQKTLVERMREVVSLLQDALGDWVGVTDTFIPENLQSISAAAKMLEDVLDQALEKGAAS